MAEVGIERRIPSGWLGVCGQDWGFDPDPCATVWNFVAAENTPLAGAIFAPAILTCRAMIPDYVAEEIKRVEALMGWAGRIQYRVMSHEAGSQLETYRVKHELHFEKWKPDAHGGIAQMQNALRLRDLRLPHPFKPWLKGRPNYFVVVPDDQVINPKEDHGLALLRAEFAAYRYTDERVSPHLGAARIVPYGFFNHFMDAQRGIAAKWFADTAPLSRQQRIEEAIPERLRLEAVEGRIDEQTEGWWMSRQRQMELAEAELAGEKSEWEKLWENTA